MLVIHGGGGGLVVMVSLLYVQAVSSMAISGVI